MVCVFLGMRGERGDGPEVERVIIGKRLPDAMTWFVVCDHCQLEKVYSGRIDVERLGQSHYYSVYRPNGWVTVQGNDYYSIFCSWACAAAECAGTALTESDAKQ